jgi:hypothetical protein
LGVIIEGGIYKYFDLGQQGGHGACSSGFGGAALAADQHTTNARIDGIQDEGAFHALLTYNGGKWIDRGHSKTSGHLKLFATYILS